MMIGDQEPSTVQILLRVVWFHEFMKGLTLVKVEAVIVDRSIGVAIGTKQGEEGIFN